MIQGLGTVNFVVIAGSLTRAVELRHTIGGRPVASFGLAHFGVAYEGKLTGRWQYFNVVAWDDLATTAASAFVKGDRITVIGRLEQRSWTMPEGGPQKSVVEIVAADFTITPTDALAHLRDVPA